MELRSKAESNGLPAAASMDSYVCGARTDFKPGKVLESELFDIPSGYRRKANHRKYHRRSALRILICLA
jgi:hypothetical protein